MFKEFSSHYVEMPVIMKKLRVIQFLVGLLFYDVEYG